MGKIHNTIITRQNHTGERLREVHCAGESTYPMLIALFAFCLAICGCASSPSGGGGSAGDDAVVSDSDGSDGVQDAGGDPPFPGFPGIAAPETDADGVVMFDALSMPRTPTHSVESFRSAAECAGCHPTHYTEWSTSAHAYAMVDPVYRALVSIRQADFEGQRDQFCVQCHSAIGTRGGEIVPNFSFESLSKVVLEGVTCEACHKIESVVRLNNAGHVLDPDGPIRGPIEDPTANVYHTSLYSPLHDTSELCGSCHDVIEQHGLNLERPYEEWAQSVAAEEGINCQHCHMPSYAGTAATIFGTPERENLHSHRFLGVEVPLLDGFVQDPETIALLRTNVTNLLQSAGEVTLGSASTIAPGEQLDVFVEVTNLLDAHNLPTGSTFNRQVWVAVTATDADGNVLYETGHLDDNGDLRDFWSELDQFGDNDLITFQSKFIDERGNPVLFPWRAAEHFYSSLSPGYTRTYTFFVPTMANTVGPIHVEAALRFRAFPPFLLRALGLGELVEKLEITDIDRKEVFVQVAGD